MTDTGMEGLTIDKVQGKMKFICNGHLLIECNGKTYDAQGMLMK